MSLQRLSISWQENKSIYYLFCKRKFSLLMIMLETESLPTSLYIAAVHSRCYMDLIIIDVDFFLNLKNQQSSLYNLSDVIENPVSSNLPIFFPFLLIFSMCRFSKWMFKESSTLTGYQITMTFARIKCVSRDLSRLMAPKTSRPKARSNGYRLVA